MKEGPNWEVDSMHATCGQCLLLRYMICCFQAAYVATVMGTLNGPNGPNYKMILKKKKYISICILKEVAYSRWKLRCACDHNKQKMRPAYCFTEKR